MAGRQSKYPRLDDSEWLRERYRAGATIYEIAFELGCSGGSVYLAMKRHGIEARKGTERVHDYRTKPCRRCGELFQPTGPAHLFCGCQNVVVACACGEPIALTRTGRPRWHHYSSTFCSPECRDVHVRSKGRRSVTKDGYVLLRVGTSVPGAYATGYIYEHRFVMQEHLGRPLLETETIHHIDGDHSNNAVENLQLRKGKHGKGQVHVCLDCGSRNIGTEEV